MYSSLLLSMHEVVETPVLQDEGRDAASVLCFIAECSLVPLCFGRAGEDADYVLEGGGWSDGCMCATEGFHGSPLCRNSECHLHLLDVDNNFKNDVFICAMEVMCRECVQGGKNASG